MKVGVCLLTSVHPPFDVRIFHKEARTLAQAGYRVSLVAPHDREDLVDGIGLRPVPKPRNRWARMTRTLWQVFRTARKTRAVVFHLHDPELILVGFALRVIGKKVIYDVHEDVPRQVLIKHYLPVGLSRLLAVPLAAIEWTAGLFFNGIVAATPTIAARFPKSKTFLVQNFPILREKGPGPSTPYQNRPARIVYVGVLSEARGIREAVLAIGLLSERPEARLRLVGNAVPDGLVDDLRRLPGWDRVEFLGWRPHGEIEKILEEARIGLVTLHPTANYLDSYPVKLFEYMASGLPAVASKFPLWEKIILESGSGVLVDPLDPQDIARGIRRLLDNPEEAEAMGQRGRKAFLERYNWNREAPRLLACYQRVLGQSKVYH